MRWSPICWLGRLSFTGAMPVLLLSLWRLGNVPAVLNFSTGTATMLACSQLAGLKQIITSRAFLERASRRRWRGPRGVPP